MEISYTKRRYPKHPSEYCARWNAQLGVWRLLKYQKRPRKWDQYMLLWLFLPLFSRWTVLDICRWRKRKLTTHTSELEGCWDGLKIHGGGNSSSIILLSTVINSLYYAKDCNWESCILFVILAVGLIDWMWKAKWRWTFVFAMFAPITWNERHLQFCIHWAQSQREG